MPLAQTPAVYFLPGCAATLTLVMINCVRRDELNDESDYDGLGNQKRAWLFFSYLSSFACLGGAIASLVTHFDKAGNDQAVGVAGVVQTVLITASAMLFWATRSPASDY